MDLTEAFATETPRAEAKRRERGGADRYVVAESKFDGWRVSRTKSNVDKCRDAVVTS